MAARIFAMRLVEASLSFVLSRDVLLRGVKTGETLRVEAVMLELLLPATAFLLEPLTLRRASMAILSRVRPLRREEAQGSSTVLRLSCLSEELKLR